MGVTWGAFLEKILIAQTNKFLGCGWWTIALKAMIQWTIDEHKQF